MSNDALVALVGVRRGQWGARAFPRSHSRVTHTHVEVHHDVFPAANAPERHCRDIEHDHLGRGWNGPFYNLGLARDGRLFELRGVGNQSYKTALTVVLFGDYENDVHLTDAQTQTLRRLRAILSPAFDWHKARHQRTGDGVASACPGRHVIPVLPTITADGAAPVVIHPESTHTVVAGESLALIAQRLGLRWQDIAAINGIQAPFVIHPGQVLRLSGAAARTYKVVRGDTLSGIGQRLGVDWRTLAADNGIVAPFVIHPGQLIRF